MRECSLIYRNRLAVLSVKLSIGSRSFSVSGPTVWNHIGLKPFRYSDTEIRHKIMMCTSLSFYFFLK